MARDGLLFSFLSHVSERKSPITSTMVAGLMSGKIKNRGWSLQQRAHVRDQGRSKGGGGKAVSENPTYS